MDDRAQPQSWNSAPLDDLDFTPHARDEMATDQIPEVAVYHVIGDADQVIEQDDGRTKYTGTWEGRVIVVVVEWDERRVITTWERKRDSRRNRRRRR